MESVKNFFSKWSEELAWLGVLLVLAGFFLIPLFFKTGLISVSFVAIGVILWASFIYLESLKE